MFEVGDKVMLIGYNIIDTLQNEVATIIRFKNKNTAVIEFDKPELSPKALGVVTRAYDTYWIPDISDIRKLTKLEVALL